MPGFVLFPNPRARVFALAGLALLLTASAQAFERTNTIFKVFQFPANRIPTIDGQTNDWAIVPGPTPPISTSASTSAGSKASTGSTFSTKPTTTTGTSPGPTCTTTPLNSS